MKATVRAGLVLALLTVVFAFAASPAQAVVFQLTSDHCTGGCGTPPFGTGTVTQNGANVDITVALAAGYSFVETGAGDDLVFKFNATGVALGDITVDAHLPQTLAGAQGTFNGDGTGLFGFGIGFASSQLTNVILADIPDEKSGVASGINSTVRQVGAALGVAVVGSVFASLTISRTVDAVKSAALPASLRDTAVAGVHAQGASFPVPRGTSGIDAAALSHALSSLHNTRTSPLGPARRSNGA